MPSFETGLRLKFEGNLESHQRWVQWLISPGFPEEISRRYQQATHLQRLVQLGKQIINEHIYSVSKGEGNIEASVRAKASAGNGGIASVSVFLDPTVSGAKGPVEGMDESKLSYAAFFERPEFNSFILGKGKDLTNPLKYRPFFDAWTQAFQEHEEREYLRALRVAMKHKMPRPINEGEA